MIMTGISRPNVDSRQILRNGKPQDYRRESLLIPMSARLFLMGGNEVRGRDFWTNTNIFLNNMPFVQALSAGGSVLGYYFFFGEQLKG